MIIEQAYRKKMEAALKEKKNHKFKKLQEKNPYRKSALRDWTEAIAWSIFAAAFIRMFTVEAYAIPTSSMEGSLNVGDYLFVSKAHYGLRTPSHGGDDSFITQSDSVFRQGILSKKS